MMVKNIKGLTAAELIAYLQQFPGDTKICIDVLTDPFPAVLVDECIYYDWENSKKVRKHKGILLR